MGKESSTVGMTSEERPEAGEGAPSVTLRKRE